MSHPPTSQTSREPAAVRRSRLWGILIAAVLGLPALILNILRLVRNNNDVSSSGQSHDALFWVTVISSVLAVLGLAYLCVLLIVRGNASLSRELLARYPMGIIRIVVRYPITQQGYQLVSAGQVWQGVALPQAKLPRFAGLVVLPDRILIVTGVKHLDRPVTVLRRDILSLELENVDGLYGRASALSFGINTISGPVRLVLPIGAGKTGMTMLSPSRVDRLAQEIAQLVRLDEG
ncbi:hypothetical protein [Lysinibacter cavernae]|uniref:Uncharacterized protein n=1 Tax=Lysinibacter cavernae TaxID=1640652 RepID=A0A7X5R020_9MICO|nr:hypothetical protein [Lysinibacter cavernae]NIH53175.1 hypothetical protein [Lysinibacter cavernae]